ncbi:unnamed protein product [Rangifer tarandus platyrhynchus]|uniref:Uncharacterized protein n=2 Tax=Rangifer tarandus platyrhynchus TaxID=3082113 RepID=A0AC59Z8B0_RANTA|nr:unnamed protein product [Rangifer tarandus platyrhynchus]
MRLLALGIQERPHPCPKSTTGRGKESGHSLAPCPLSGPQFPLLLEVSLPSEMPSAFKAGGACVLPTLHHGDASSFCSGGSQPAPPHPQWELGPPCSRDTGDTSQIHGHDLWETQEHWTRSLDITVSVLAPSQLAVCPRRSHIPSLVPGKLWCLDRNVPILLALAVCTLPLNLPAMTPLRLLPVRGRTGLCRVSQGASGWRCLHLFTELEGALD